MATTTLAAGTTTYSVETTVAVGDVLQFPPNSSATLVMDNKNLIVYGTLRMRPANANVVHLLQFINVDESIMVGSGMTPISTDIGLWVMDNGILDAVGTPRAGWNRTGDDSTWLSTDEMLKVPWGPFVGSPTALTGPWDSTTFATHTKGGALGTTTDPWGVVHTQEALNLTRNVRIEGTAGHNTHVFIRTDVGQTISYISLRYVGPRKAIAPATKTDVLVGRWGLHLHHLMDAGYDTVITGVVVRDCPSHSFVAHDSHGVLFDDCIAYSVNESAYWWDKGSDADRSNDVIYRHCMGAKVSAAPNGNTALSSLTIFDLSHTLSSTVEDSVAVGVIGTTSTSGFLWPEEPGLPSTSPGKQGLWHATDLVSHNNRGVGVYVWQNSSRFHHPTNITTFRNAQGGIIAGAYINDYRWEGIRSFQNGQEDLKLVANNSRAAPLNSRHIDTKTGYTQVRESTLASPGYPTLFLDCEFTILRINETSINKDAQGNPIPENGPGHFFDFVRCDVEPAMIDLYFMDAQSVYRVQRQDNSAYRINANGTYTTISPFYLYISTLALTQGVQGTPYSQPLASQLGTGAVTWGLKSGSGPLPTGLSLSSGGTISGTPTVAGVYPITVEATDANGETAPRTYSFVVTGAAALQITTASLVGGIVGTLYSQPLAATGGAQPYTWTLASGTLPTGLTLSTGGTISGIPSTQNFYTFTVRVTDLATATSTRALSINVINITPDITTTSLPGGETGVVYSAPLLVTNGTPPYTWTITSGTLPTGLSLAAGTGIISGTPTVAGTSTLGIRVTDSTLRTDNVSLDLVVTTPIVLDPFTGSEALKGTAYTYTFTATGGTPPYTFTAGNPDQLPPGLTLLSDGVLSGTPTLQGVYEFSVFALSGVGISGALFVTLTVNRLMVRPQPGDSLSTFPGIINEIETYLEENIAIVGEGAIGSAVVTAGVTTLPLTSIFTQADAAYQAIFEPSWQTTTVAATKTTTGLTVTFGTPVPTGGGIVRWRIKR